MTARLLVGENLPRLSSEDTLLPQSIGEDDADEPAMISIADAHIMLSGIFYGFEKTPDRMETRTTMDRGRQLVSRLAANRPTPRQAKSGGVGENKRKHVGSFAPSLQNCSMRTQRQDAFGEHTRSVHEEGMRAASAYTQGQHPRVAEATMHLEYRDPARGLRLTRRLPLWMSER